MKHTAFFGDGEKTFALTTPMILELQRTTGHGVGAIFRRVQSQDFGIQEIAEVIRLGLIGGGIAPFTADALVKTYVDGRPLVESVEVALDVLAARFFGEAVTITQDETGQADPADKAAKLRDDIARAFDSDVQEAAATGDLAAALSEASNG